MYMNIQQDYNSANKLSDSIITPILTLSIAKSILLNTVRTICSTMKTLHI